MKTTSFLTLSILGSAALLCAQEVSTPVVEVGGSYSYMRVNPGGGLSSYNTNGGFGTVEYNLNKVVGVVAELGGDHVGTSNGLTLNNTTFSYLFGPRFNWRLARFTPYVQTLVGGERFSSAFNPVTGASASGVSQNNFAVAIGGGIDYNLNKRIALKPVQVEYVMAQVPQTGTNFTFTQNNLRYSAGVVFRFGSK
ncbi:MAG TPA: outer membrane beta-barrel protein [Bryobacteraceae bacterium]|nr:outer membrane beta-barrel protein [Bryobacteraceae bacterium]